MGSRERHLRKGKTLFSERPWSVDSGLSPELRALLACAEAVVDRRRLDAYSEALVACPSVDALCEAATTHRMLGHLHMVITAESAVRVEPGLKLRLGELQRALALRNLRDTTVLLDILARLDDAGVGAMPVKGPVWAQLLYGDLASRCWADLDLLVGRDQVTRAREVLLGSGFSDCSPWNERTIRSGWGDTGQIALGSSGLGLVIDLHWRLAVSVGPKGLTSESVFAHAGVVDLLDHKVPCPGSSDVFLMTCVEGARDRWARVGRLLDLAVQVSRLPLSDWPLLTCAAEAAGCRRIVAVSVAHTCRVLGFMIPETVLRDLAADRRGLALARSLQPRQLSALDPEGLRTRLGMMRWQAAGEDHWTDGVRYLMARLFAPTTEDRESLGVSGWAEWTYYLLRPGRLMLKWSKRMMHMARRTGRAT